MANGSGHFWIRRLHSLTGIVLGVAYLIFFLIPNSVAIGGAEDFNLFAAITNKIPLLGELEFLLILLPLIFHAAVGLSIIYSSQFNVISYGSYRNWMYALQRITGIFMAPFLLYHIYATRLLFAFTGRFADFAYMQKLMTPLWAKVLYGAGVAFASFHIGNGIAFALTRWGITASKRSQEVASMVMWGVTLVLGLWGARVIMSF